MLVKENKVSVFAIVISLKIKVDFLIEIKVNFIYSFII